MYTGELIWELVNASNKSQQVLAAVTALCHVDVRTAVTNSPTRHLLSANWYGYSTLPLPRMSHNILNRAVRWKWNVHEHQSESTGDQAGGMWLE